MSNVCFKIYFSVHSKTKASVVLQINTIKNLFQSKMKYRELEFLKQDKIKII